MARLVVTTWHRTGDADDTFTLLALQEGAVFKDDGGEADAESDGVSSTTRPLGSTKSHGISTRHLRRRRLQEHDGGSHWSPSTTGGRYVAAGVDSSDPAISMP